MEDATYDVQAPQVPIVALLVAPTMQVAAHGSGSPLFEIFEPASQKALSSSRPRYSNYFTPETMRPRPLFSLTADRTPQGQHLISNAVITKTAGARCCLKR